VHDWQGYTWSKRNFAGLPLSVTAGTVEGYSSKGGPHFQAPETRPRCRCFTNLENLATYPAARPIRMHEESAYLGRIVLRIKQRIFAAGTVVASIERLAPAPTPATGYDRVGLPRGFGYKVSAILNQLGIHTKNQLQRLFSLLRRILACLQPQDGSAYEILKRRNIGKDSLSNREQHAVAGYQYEETLVL
jgi:hypothetical protein